MDSLTQITLGAAVGELVLGRKIGNRAMFWGAVGGTIPDLDVFANFATDELSSLAFHRSITHSVFFAVVTPFALGWLVHQLYNARGKSWGALWKSYGLTTLLFLLITLLGASVLPIPTVDTFKISAAVTTGIMIVPLFVLLREKFRKKPLEWENPKWQSWAWLFFWAILTHPLLDCCTTYGTQLFQPFWDYRVGLNNISVADPIYTLPFLLCVIIASFFTRTKPIRKYFNYAGIAISSAYMFFTVYNKFRINTVFENTFVTQNIGYQRYMTTPTIFNNILWNGVAEVEDAYYLGMYSFNDKSELVEELSRIPKNHGLVARYQDGRAMQILRWFTNGYYAVKQREDGNFVVSDMRFGRMGSDSDADAEFVFSFVLEDQNGELIMVDGGGGPPDDGEAEKIFAALWTRIKGI